MAVVADEAILLFLNIVLCACIYVQDIIRGGLNGIITIIIIIVKNGAQKPINTVFFQPIGQAAAADVWIPAADRHSP